MATQTTYKYKVEMTCEGCSNAVRKVLGKLNGVSSIEIEMEEQIVYVTASVGTSQLEEALKKAGKPFSLIGTQ